MEVVVAVVALAALVWGAVLFLRGGLLAGCVAVLLAGICFGHPMFHTGGALPLTADRCLWAVLLVQYLVWRQIGRTDPKPLALVDVLVLTFVAALGIGVFTHDWQAHRFQPLARWAIFYVMPLGLYWVARQARVTERTLSAVLTCLTLFGIYLAMTGMAETWGIAGLVFPRYILSPEWPEFLGRARGPLLNPIGNGLLLSTCLAACLVEWPRAGRVGKLFLLGAATLMALGVYCTLTRSVWMGAAAGTAVVVGLAAPRAVRVGMLGAGLLVAALAASQWDRLVAFKRDRDLSAAATAESVQLRPILAQVAWRMSLDRPLLGCGLGQYEDESRAYLSDRTTDLPLEKARGYVQHNVFLSLLTETGIVGLGLFVMMLALWTRDALRVWRDPASPQAARQFTLVSLAFMANYAINGMFHDVSIIAMANMSLFFAAGLMAGLAHASRPCSGWRGRLVVDGRIQRIGAGA